MMAIADVAYWRFSRWRPASSLSKLMVFEEKGVRRYPIASCDVTWMINGCHRNSLSVA
jgi:hypothetical protein